MSPAAPPSSDPPSKRPGAFADRLRAIAEAARFSPRQRGAVLGAVATAALLVAVTASRARLGFGAFGDVLVGLAALAVASGLYALAAAALVRSVRAFAAIPRTTLVGVLAGATVVLTALAGVRIVQPLTLAVLLIAALWGAVLGGLLAGPTHPAPRRRTMTVALALAGSAALWFGLARRSGAAPAMPSRASAPSAPLAARGQFAVRSVRYGSGADARRATYGAADVIRVDPVDLSAALPALRGWRALIHARYWGVTPERMPVNATAWLPQGDGPVPVALLLHGLGVEERSEAGFAYLGEQLASHGIAAISIDANPLSGPWIREADGAIGARVQLVRAHLDALGRMDRDPTSPFHGRLDRSRIALVGHSRGGETMAAVAMFEGRGTAGGLPTAALDSAMRVRAVVALSPTEGLYHPNGRDVTMRGVSYLLIRGTRDADVPSEAGSGQFTRVRFPDSGAGFKAAVVIPGANHVQFNSSWGRRDRLPPLGWLLRDDEVIDARIQRELTASITSAFLDEALVSRPGAMDRFATEVDRIAQRAAISVPRRVTNARTVMLETAEDDADPFRASAPGATVQGDGFRIWREWHGDRTANTVVQLMWPGAVGPAATYAMRLGDDRAGLPLSAGTSLVLSAASLGGAIEFSVELESDGGGRARWPLVLPADAEFTRRSPRWRSRLLERQLVPTAVPALHTFLIPLDSLAARPGGLVPARLRAIRLVFDRTAPGGILLDDIGLRPAPRAVLP